MGAVRALTLVLFLEICVQSRAVDDFLPNWMGRVGTVLADQSFFDLTLPGTHDTMTYDLSTTIADGGIDDEDWLSAILNDFGHLGDIGQFIRTQAQTQSLTVSQQLDAGIRFLDFRIMYTSGAWHCLHMVQSNQKVVTYLKEIRAWMDSHPTEIIAIWLSKHGSECATGQEQYPGVSKDAKQTLWREIEDVFSGSLLNTSQSSLKDTPISELVKRNHRVIIFASDFAEFTGNSTLATDGCLVDNPLSMSDIDGLSLASDLKTFSGFASRRATDKTAGKFLLESMANSPPKVTIEAAAKIRFLPGGTSNIPSCAAAFNIPGLTQWCPESLLDVGQLTAYYKQTTIDAAYNASYEFPNAIYIDAIAPGGLIRTGTRPLSAGDSSPVCDIYKWTSCQSNQPTCDPGWTANGEKAHWNSYDPDGTLHGFCGLAWQNHYKCCRNKDSDHATDGYAYVDTLIAHNVRKACKDASKSHVQQCSSAEVMMAARRAHFSRTVWTDEPTGRLNKWPSLEATDVAFV